MTNIEQKSGLPSLKRTDNPFPSLKLVGDSGACKTKNERSMKFRLPSPKARMIFAEVSLTFGEVQLTLPEVKVTLP